MYDRGWTPVNDINAGEWILTETGDWQAVQEVYATGEWETVYNLRVEDHHTYFVGDDDWGWSLWAHNACSKEMYISKDSDNWNAYTLYDKSNGLKIRVGKGQSLPEGTTMSVVGDFAAAKAYAQNHAADFGIRMKAGEMENVIKSDPSEITSWTNVVGASDARGVSKTGFDTAYTTFRNSNPSFFTTTRTASEVADPASAVSQTGLELVGGSGAFPGRHAHHIVMKKGHGATSQGFVQETHRILRTVGIDPFYSQNNLAWAPNWINHPYERYAQAVLNDLSKLGFSAIADQKASDVDLSKQALVIDRLKAIADKFVNATYPM